MNNNNILTELFYNPKFGYLSTDKFIKKVQLQYPDIKTSDIKEFIKNQEITQLSKKASVNKYKMHRINGPELTFQIDLVFLPKALKSTVKINYNTNSADLFVFLLCVDVLSRKAFIYPMKNKTKEEIMRVYKEFLGDIVDNTNKLIETPDFYNRPIPFAITTDDGFKFKEFKELNDKLGIN